MHVAAGNDFAADPTTVFSMLTDPEFHSTVATRIHALEHDFAFTGNRTENLRVVPTPEVAARFAGATMEIIEIVEWGEPAADGSRSGSLDVSVKGKPVTWQGSTTLAAGGRGSVLQYEGDFNVRIPIVGKMLEKQAVGALEAIIRAQQRVGDERLG